jgi:hypothetical protein
MTNAVINNPVHLRKIWATLKGRVPTGQTSGGFNQSVIGKNRGPGAPQTKVLFNTLDIFENILEDPLHPDHYQQFLQLMIALCGNRQYQSGIEVLNLLQSSSLKNIDSFMAMQKQPAFSQLSSKRSLGGRQEKPFANP